MKIIALGDIHGHNTWKNIISKHEDFDKIIFIGDYFDSFDKKAEEQVNNFLDIVEFKKSEVRDVILLIGNHDHHYFAGIGDSGTSGFQHIGQYQITPVLETHKESLQMAHSEGDILFTHAGVSEIFMKNMFEDTWENESIAETLNELWKNQPLKFSFNGRDSYGDDIYQTPIWIRSKSLMYASGNLKEAGIVQVVGHTHSNKIRVEDGYYFIDALPNEYLLIEDGVIKIQKYENNN